MLADPCRDQTILDMDPKLSIMSKNASETPSRSASYLATLVFVVGMLRLVVLFRKSDCDLVKMIPDDAFYYLVPARSFATLGRWTFDGVEPSSGFHLLWGYLLASFFHWFHRPLCTTSLLFLELCRSYFLLLQPTSLRLLPENCSAPGFSQVWPLFSFRQLACSRRAG